MLRNERLMKNATCFASGKENPRNPNMFTRSRPSLLAVGALICSMAGAPQLWAQAVGLQNEYRLVSVSAGKEVRVYPQFVDSSTPLVNQDTNNGVNGGSISDASIDVSTYYGAMSVTGSGDASNSPTNGTFAWIDTPIGGDPFSKYQDVLNVTSSTLAKGTAVTIDFTESFVTSFSGYNPSSFQDNLHISDTAGLDNWNLTLTSTSSASFEFHTVVGDSLNLEGDLHGGGAAYASDASPPIESQYFSFYESGPLYITSVTNGVDIQSDSGATYAPASSIPEPSTYAAIAGVLVLGVAAIRRRRPSPGITGF